MRTAEEQREYQRAYYQAHKEQAKVYQREYNRRNRARRRRGVTPGDVRNHARFYGKGNNYNYTDIMHASPERAAAIVNKVTRREAVLVGPR